MIEYIDAFSAGLTQILPFAAQGQQAFLFMLVGIFVGFWIGILPGLGAAAALALMLPFVYKMDTVAAFAFLLGMNTVNETTGDITSVLFGVPGEATTTATIVDGHPMAKNGEAGVGGSADEFSRGRNIRRHCLSFSSPDHESAGALHRLARVLYARSARNNIRRIPEWRKHA
jgi:hypothetical protein